MSFNCEIRIEADFATAIPLRSICGCATADADGLSYVTGFVGVSFERCFQVMECDDPALSPQWIVQWRDLLEFEIAPVLTSAENRKSVALL